MSAQVRQSEQSSPPPEPEPPPKTNEQDVTQNQEVGNEKSQSPCPSDDDNQSTTSSVSTPQWLKWSNGLDSLLDDDEGRDVFEKFLQEHRCLTQLHFLWACEGLKCTASEDPPKATQLIRSIHRTFFQDSTLLGITPSTRANLGQAIVQRNSSYEDLTLFDKAKAEVYSHMEDNLYPNFLKSEAFFCALNADVKFPPLAPPPSSSGRSSSMDDETKKLREVGELVASSPPPPLPRSLLRNQLQTVNEETASIPPQVGEPTPSAFTLTAKALQITERSRIKTTAAPQPTLPKLWTNTASSSSTSRGGPPLHPYHAAYASYNPVSRVSSETHSRSSGATTSSRGSSRVISNRNCGGDKSFQARDTRHEARENSSQPSASAKIPNRPDNLRMVPMWSMAGSKVPFTLPQRNPTAFAEQIISKLETLSTDHEKNIQLKQKLKETDDTDRAYHDDTHPQRVPPPSYGNALASGKELHGPGSRSQEDTDPDDILDQHVSRVFLDTPTTPGSRSQKLKPPVAPRLMSQAVSTSKRGSIQVHPSSRTLETNSIISASKGPQNPPAFGTPQFPSRHQLPPQQRPLQEHFITSIVTYEDATQLPYILKIPSGFKTVNSAVGNHSFYNRHGITLEVFKAYLPKRGQFRYFFKREFPEVEAKAVQEEMTDHDVQEIPLFEGKIVAHLKPIVGACR